MRIKSIANSSDRAGRFRTVLEDETVMQLYRQTIEDFDLYVGQELSDDEMKQLRKSAGEMSTKMRAVRIVSASSVSTLDLEHRLVQKGESPEQAKAAVTWMSELSLLDDSKTAEQVVSRCIAKGYGLLRAKQALYEKRIPKQFWDAALADYPDQSDKIKDFLASRLLGNPSDKDRKRSIDALLRKGHSYGQIRRALAELAMDTDDFQED